MTDEPLAPEPDTKDWTWVVQRACPECGFDGPSVDPATVGHELVDLLDRWRAAILRAGDRVADRWEDRTWSVLEYACHVRDVFELYERRLQLMLNEDGPHFPNWDQDATAIEKRYHQADPVIVSSQLTATGKALAAGFRMVRDDEWERTGFRGDGAEFTVATFAVYLLHDPYHHLHDVELGLQRLASSAS